MIIESILMQSLAFLPMALGVYLSYAVLRTADLTVDGSFVLGAGVMARLVAADVPPFIAMAIAVMIGAIAGVCVSLIQYKEKVPPLIAGILALFILQSLNLVVMGRPNISLLNYPSILDGVLPEAITLSIAAAVLLVGAVLLLRSRLGLMLRAFGINPLLLSLLGKKTERFRMAGLSMGNGLAALSGAVTAELDGYADIGMGSGLVLVALGAVIIGQQLQGRLTTNELPGSTLQLTCCLAGVVLYFSVVHLLLKFGLDPTYLKMMIGVALIACLLYGKEKLLLDRRTA